MLERIMRAFVINKPTKAEDVKLTDNPIPQVKSGWVLVKVRAFGLNHSEQILRLQEINEPYIKKPVIPGIECVGEIVDASDSHFTLGQKVIALMGGMGRSFDGSYAEFALLPMHHVFSVKSELTWEELGAIPETYFTAWGSLVESLHLRGGDRLLIRGATCALGYAAISLAKAMGASVIATTHREKKSALLEETGADEIILDDSSLKGKIPFVDKALELVGAKTLLDTMQVIKPGSQAYVCCTGILGGIYALDAFDPIKDIPNGVYLTGFFSNYPTQKVIDDIFRFIAEKKIKPKIGKVYDFDNLREACLAQDSGKVSGKIVVRVPL